MPGSTALYQTDQDEEGKDSEPRLTSNRQPPPVAPRTSVTLQSWQSVTSGHDNYGDNKHARSASMDSLESSGSSSSGGGSSISNHRILESGVGEYISTRIAGKVSKLPSHNPLQFVKVQSPLYRKAEQQIKLTKEVKITREAVKEGEEEWQSNLDNWKSRRRKVTEKVIQRAEEIRQIEAEEQLRHEQCLLQQRKIKKFSEIVERRSSRSYNLDLYIGQGDDSGLGGTPEPDDVIDSQSSILRSDTSEGMTSEAESIDSDTHKSDKVQEKGPVLHQKPQSWLKRNTHMTSSLQSPTHSYLSEIADKELHSFDNISSAEPSDIEGHVGDSETISSEEDIGFADNHKLESDIENIDQSNLAGNEILNEQDFHDITEHSNYSHLLSDSDIKVEYKRNEHVPITENQQSYRIHAFKICTKSGDNKGFGFSVKGGKDLGCTPYIDSITLDGPANIIGLKEGDEIISLNGELASTYSHASLIFTVKQAVYMGILDIEISRSVTDVLDLKEMKPKSANKKSSFAEKLALFSSGTSSDKTKSSQSSSKPDVKKESLVLRRRSAFETSNSENAIHHRSSCLLRETSNTDHHNSEKRYSMDLTSQSHIKKNNNVKKDPPPPVPAKPKLKTKQILKTEIVNDDKCDNLTQLNTFSANPALQLLSDSVNISTKDTLIDDTCITVNEVLKCNNIDTEKECAVSGFDCFSNANPTSEVNNIKNIYPLESISHVSANDVTTINVSSENCNFIDETFDNKLSLEINNFFSTSTNSLIENSLCTDSHKIDNSMSSNIIPVENSDLPNKTENISTSCSTLEVSPLDVHRIKTDDTSDIMLCSKENVELQISDVKDDFSDNLSETIQYKSDIHASAYDEMCNINNDNVDSATEITSNEGHEVIGIEYENKNTDELATTNLDLSQFEDISTVENLAENVTIVHLNPSPLCLSLEKTDEDDVISASTTTSSETPDTETVIETLPLNLSPLPNDESNGEDSSKPLNSNDEQVESQSYEPVQIAENTSVLKLDEINTSQISVEQSSENIPNQDNFNCDNSFSATNDDVFIDEQDEEYRLELDESLDQITALDVIDEMEHRLMQQLEHQDDNFEELDEGLTLQLENDINQDWMYYSEVDLLEDYTPQNREPPREPPPPPPIEPEASVEVLPLTRINSTKRIKKELWRRRSDFLGLNSSEGIDVDNILPPPPGLEEILKLEREQNQWLEKRLSLAETDVCDSSSAGLDSQDLLQNEYSSYLLTDEDDDSKYSFDVSSGNWQENMEENVFESNDSHSIIDMQTQVSEDSTKIKESPHHKAKQNIQNLGAAPKAKIMDSNKWITEKVTPLSKKTTEPVFRQASYDQNYWIAQDIGRKQSQQSDIPNRRYSMTSHTNSHPDVTLRTWDDRENEFQKQRPRSAVWNSPSNSGTLYGSESCLKQDILRTHSLDDTDEIRCDTDILESEVHQCSCCGKGLCEGSAMGIEALRLYFHIECFRCCMCQMLLGNGMCGTDVQVKNNQLYCPNCFTVD